jgi:superfamily II DNA/RNA helicase
MLLNRLALGLARLSRRPSYSVSLITRNNLGGEQQTACVQKQPSRLLNYTPISTENKITVSHKMIQTIEKKRSNQLLQEARNQRYVPDKNAQKLIISCSNKLKNHYSGQAYRDFSERNLASYGWRSRRSTDQYFTINAFGSHPSIKKIEKLETENKEQISFDYFNLSRCLLELARVNYGIEKPTYIQYLALNEILSRQSHHLVLAETGGGKTLAYSLPLVDSCALTSMYLSSSGVKRDCLRQPFAIVIVPTRELAFQVHAMIKRLIDTRKLEQMTTHTLSEHNEAAYLNAIKGLNVVVDMHSDIVEIRKKHLPEESADLQIDCVDELLVEANANTGSSKSIDILITLPGQLKARLCRQKPFFNSVYLKHLVLDEADTLLDDSYNRLTLECLRSLQLNLDFSMEQYGEKEPHEQFSAHLGDVSSETEDIAQDDYADGNHENSELKASLKRHLENVYAWRTRMLREPCTQLLLVSATMPHEMKKILESVLDCDANLRIIDTLRTNRLMFHVPQKFIRSNANKRSVELVELVRKELQMRKREIITNNQIHSSTSSISDEDSTSTNRRIVLIFSNRAKTAVYVSKLLNENGIKCELLINRLPNEERAQIVSRFFKGDIRVLSCTDIASRGWDTLHVSHVVNFEMPTFIADYIHRIGRVGRPNSQKHGGNNGKVTSFITKKYEVDLVWNIERSVRLSGDLSDVNANIKSFFNKKYSNQNSFSDKQDSDFSDSDSISSSSAATAV